MGGTKRIELEATVAEAVGQSTDATERAINAHRSWCQRCGRDARCLEHERLVENWYATLPQEERQRLGRDLAVAMDQAE